MRTIRLLILSDGPNELGSVLDEDLTPSSLPALPNLVHRISHGHANVTYCCRQFKSVRHAPGRGHKYAGKVKQAVRIAWEEEFDAVVIVVDRDRNHDSERIVPLRQGRDEMDAKPFPKCVVGMAIEAFDAWMVVDGKAVDAAGGDASRAHPDPEKLDGEEGTGRHPKDRAIELFGSRSALTGAYAKAAAVVDLDLLEKCCQKGFKPFADEVRERIAKPLLGV